MKISYTINNSNNKNNKNNKNKNTMAFEARELFGKTVRIEIPGDNFPTQEQIDGIDEITGKDCRHGWYESVSKGNQNTDEAQNANANANLHYRYWLPDDPKGIVIFTHGISSQSGHASRIDGRPLDMALMVDTFTKKGFAVYARDQYGHGFSEGMRFYIPAWQESRDDLIRFVKLVAGQHPTTIPLFLSGESFGGTLTLLVSRYFQDHPSESPPNLDASLLVCPAIVGDVPGFPVYHLLRYLLAPIWPTRIPFFMPNTVSGARIWKDPEVVLHHTNPAKTNMLLDSIGNPFRLGTAVNLLEALEDVRNHAIPGYNRPFVVVHGDQDAAVPIAGSKLLLENSSTATHDKELHVLETTYHGVLADPKAEEAMNHMVAFVDARTKKFVSN
mmetsp:Transcript_25407/g.53553  ORF Transcript_25407/g.53553 Transcript_25407/m.53553 type:complete len:387 (+) Transcript_25407:312-1472(+)